MMPGVWTAVCLIFLTPLTSFLPRGFPIPFFRLNEAILLILFCVVVLQNLIAGSEGRKRLFRVSWLDLLFGLLFFTGTIIPLSAHLLTTHTVTLANVVRYFDLLQFYMLYRILIVVVDDKKKVLACILALVTAGIVIALIGILEARNVPPVRQLIATYYPSYNLQRNIALGYPRVVSLMGAPQTYAAFLVINIFICLTLLLDSKASTVPEIPRRFIALGLFISFLGFVPSGGYSAVIGAAFMFLLLLWFYRRLPYWVWVVGSVSLAIGGMLFAPLIFARFQFQFQHPGDFIPFTLQRRFDHWALAIKLLSPSDLLLSYRGVLPSTFLSFENQYIHFLFRGGILFVGAFIYFIVRVVSESYKTFQQSVGLIKPIALCTFIVIIGFSLMGMTDSYFTNSGVSEAIWTLVSITAIGQYLGQQDIHPVPTSLLIASTAES